MHSIKRDDGTKLLIEFSSNATDKVVILLSGYGYSINHPILYYARAVARQNKYNTISIDFDYLNNSKFLELNSESQDRYFDEDIKRILEYFKKMEFSKRIFVGKSMGTTAIFRFVEHGIINENDKLIYITPGSKWKEISENIIKSTNITLVIGSLADPKYTNINLENVHKAKNVEFLEFIHENHSLEINQFENDLKAVLEVSTRIHAFINT